MSVLSYYFTSAARFIRMAPEHVRQHTHGPVTHSSIRLEVIFSDPKKAHRILLEPIHGWKWKARTHVVPVSASHVTKR
jgi:hypothetical protein